MTIGPENDLEAVDIDIDISPDGESAFLAVILVGGGRLYIHLHPRLTTQLAERIQRAITRASGLSDPP